MWIKHLGVVAVTAAIVGAAATPSLGSAHSEVTKAAPDCIYVANLDYNVFSSDVTAGNRCGQSALIEITMDNGSDSGCFTLGPHSTRTHTSYGASPTFSSIRYC